MKYAVVTRIPDAGAGEAGNMALGEVYFATAEQPSEANGYLGRVMPAMPQLGRVAIALRVPVFVLGEILILEGAHGREVSGRGRKPGKWDVDVEHFDSIEDAVARAREVSP